MRKTTRDAAIGAVTATGLMALIVGGVIAGVAPATAGDEPVASAPALVVATDAPNGLASEQEAEAAAAEAARIAAEVAAADAARLAAEAEASAGEPVEGESVDEVDEGDESPEPAPAPSAPPAPTTEWDPNTTPHTVCEVLADGTPVPCQ